MLHPPPPILAPAGCSQHTDGLLLDAQLLLELSMTEKTGEVWEGEGHAMQKFRAQNRPISACWQLQGL